MEIKLTSAFPKVEKRFLLFIMRTFIFLCCTLGFGITPISVVSQSSKITIEQDQMITVDEVFDLIMAQTDYNFFYEEGIFKNLPEILVKKGKIKTNQLLSKVLASGSLNVQILADNSILITEKPLAPTVLLPQQITLSGLILDAYGEPLPGANIIEKGTI